MNEGHAFQKRRVLLHFGVCKENLGTFKRKIASVQTILLLRQSRRLALNSGQFGGRLLNCPGGKAVLLYVQDLRHKVSSLLAIRRLHT